MKEFFLWELILVLDRSVRELAVAAHAELELLEVAVVVSEQHQHLEHRHVVSILALLESHVLRAAEYLRLVFVPLLSAALRSVSVCRVKVLVIRG